MEWHTPPETYPPRLTPIKRPIPKVMAAAPSPIPIWRSPENTTPRPVKRLVPAPIANRATQLEAMLTMIAMFPDRKKKPMMGKTAPIANRQKEEAAAPQAEPPRSSGSIPSSSRTRVSRAVSLFDMSWSASARACASGTPFA